MSMHVEIHSWAKHCLWLSLVLSDIAPLPGLPSETCKGQERENRKIISRRTKQKEKFGKMVLTITIVFNFSRMHFIKNHVFGIQKDRGLFHFQVLECLSFLISFLQQGLQQLLFIPGDSTATTNMNLQNGKTPRCYSIDSAGSGMFTWAEITGST